MTPPTPRTIESIVESRLCTGCGVCAHLHPDRLRMADVPEVGLRPLPIVGVSGATTGAGVEACPGRSLNHPPDALEGAPFRGEWGPVLALHECWSTDDDLRHRGSSGGVVTALAAHAVASGIAVGGALQVRASTTDPLRNETVLNRTYEEITSAAGSRYAPASPCERLDLVEEAEGPCVVVGKPCDVAGTRMAAASRPALDEKVAVTLGIFCAGTPSTNATRDLVTQLGMDPEHVDRLDYRGEGWPGEFRVRAGDQQASMSYAESWGQLTKHRQWRCLICPDHTGEFADLSIGDPWYRTPGEGDLGRSLVVVRTERGLALLESALASGALAGTELPLERLPQSQPSLEATRGAVWGRVLAMRALGMPTPRFRGMPSLRLWWRLPLRAKARSTLGTARRVFTRRLRRPEIDLEQVR